MTSTETFTTLNGQAREATQKTAEAFQQGVHQAADRTAELARQLPQVDISEGVQKYFEWVQQAVDVQREMAITWAELMTSMAGSLRDQAESFTHRLTEQTDKAADLVGK